MHNKERILVTGSAGFIGAAVVLELLRKGYEVIGIDNLNDYYDVSLKKGRLINIENNVDLNKVNYIFKELSITNKKSLDDLFLKHKPSICIHLAAQAGVRYSIENPLSYTENNLIGFSNILESCRNFGIKNLVYASSSSVYGGNKKVPFSEKDPVNHPVSFYAATKRANELMAHTYSHLYGLSATGLRFFTVYGPWGRPDMAPMIFAKAILAGDNLEIFNYGKMQRDFTYIDDIVLGIIKCAEKQASINLSFDKFNPDPATSFASHRIFNIGNNNPVPLMRFVELLEKALNIKAKLVMKEMQPGDVPETLSDTQLLEKWVGFKPNTNIEKGVEKFIKWYLQYYKGRF